MFKIHKLFSGAPIQLLKDTGQQVEFYWRGKLYKKISFKENRFHEFHINFNDQGFLELRVYPTFNLKKMGIGNETRDLGVQLHH